MSHLNLLFKSLISHGFVPYLILLCTLLPLVKDNLGDISSSENYRAIASGSLLLKLLDIFILLLESEKLACDQLQFGFQQDSGTVMCTLTATRDVNYSNRQRRPVYGCAMDLSKAFDMVDWKELFQTLRKRKANPILIRILIFMYWGQQCNVKWAQSFSFCSAWPMQPYLLRGGGLRGPPLAELAIAPKRIYILIWNLLTFLIYQKPKFWRRKKFDFFTPPPLGGGY